MINRPILIILLGYIIGIIIGLYCNISIAIFIIPIVVIYLSIKFIYKKSIIQNKKLKHYLHIFNIKKVILIFLISIVISNTIVLILNNKYDLLFKNIKEVQYLATIVEAPTIKQYGARYKIKIESINKDTRKFKNTYLYLNTKNKNLKVGYKVTFIGEFIEPEIKRNYGGFNYKEYLKSIGIYGSVNANHVKIIGNGNISKIKLVANKVSNYIKETVAKNIENESNRNLLLGILLGNDDNLESEIKESFAGSNLSHLLAVSGMHISYVILGISIILSKLKFPKKITKISTIILLIFFIFLTGETPSVKRACIMAIMSIIASLIYRKSDTITNISTSLLIILIQNPFSIMNIGLILSYFATLGIVLFYKRVLNFMKKPIYLKAIVSKGALEKITEANNKRNKTIIKTLLKDFCNKIREIISVSISAQILTFPLSMLIFNKISLTFLFSNILVSLIIGVIIILGFLSIIFQLKICFNILEILLSILTKIANIFSKIPISNIIMKTPSLVFVICYYIIIIFIFYIIFLRKKQLKRTLEIMFLAVVDTFKSKLLVHKRHFFISILLVIILAQSIKLIPKDLKIHFIDVGQGDSCLIITPKNKTILIDGGGSRADNFNVRKKYITSIFAR